MSDTQTQQEAIQAAEAALDAGDLDGTMDLLSPFFQSGLQPRALWLVARVLTRSGQAEQAFKIFKQAFDHDPSLPFIEIAVGDSICSFYDVPGSLSILTFAEEFANDIYGLKDLQVLPGDVVIDIGANVGFVSIALAVLYPGVRVLAFEPVPDTFTALRKNLAENAVENVTAVNKAINGDGRDLELLVMTGDSGAANAFRSDAVMERYLTERIGHVVTVSSTTLDDVFKDHGVEHCRLLKLDCEGAEHEILRSTGVLSKIDQVVMELHINFDELAGRQAADYTNEFVTEIKSRAVPAPDIRVASVVGVRSE